MDVAIAGEGGAALVAASRCSRPPSLLLLEGLAEPARTSAGVTAHPVDALDGLAPAGVGTVQIVGGEAATRRAVNVWASEHGLPVEERSLDMVAPPPGVRVIAVSSPSTGSGKTALVRRVARALRRTGTAVGVARHPLPNLLLWDGRSEAVVLRSPMELREPRPIEEWEELAPVIGTGTVVASGLDPEGVLRAATRAVGPGGVVIWDGGGSAMPWVRPHLHLVAVDLLRELAEGAEAHVRAADAIVLTKADSAPKEHAAEREALVRSWNPHAPVILTDMPPAVPEGAGLIRKRVVVVEDQPSLLLGGLKAGAGAIVARRFHCGVVDPRPFARGAVARALADHPHVGAVIPSVGRTPGEIEDLVASVRATPGDAVLWASPADPEVLLAGDRRPIFRCYSDLIEVAGGSIPDLLTHPPADAPPSPPGPRDTT